MNEKFDINIPHKIGLILNVLNKNGHQAYCVGGCVRDSLLNLEPKDWDVATDATPEKIQLLFNNYIEGLSCKTIPTGEKFGTITINLGNEMFEVTTFRTESSYEDGRRPAVINFGTSLKEDLMRRDFTINAIVYSPKEGLIDPFNGISDLKDRIIRCVGDSSDRFEEDALRMLRALRFATRFNFEIEEETSRSITKNIKLLNNVSKERVNSELNQILKNAPGMKSNLTENLFDMLGYLFNVTKEVLLQKLEYMVLFNTKFNFSNFIEILKIIFDCNTDLTYSWLKEYKFSNNEITYTLKIINIGSYFNNLNKHEEEITDYEIKVALNKFSEFYMLEAFSGSLYMKVRIIELSQDPHKLEDLEINGYDLLNIGISGKHIREILDICMNDVLQDVKLNSRKYLINRAKELKKGLVCLKH